MKREEFFLVFVAFFIFITLIFISFTVSGEDPNWRKESYNYRKPTWTISKDYEPLIPFTPTFFNTGDKLGETKQIFSKGFGGLYYNKSGEWTIIDENNNSNCAFYIDENNNISTTCSSFNEDLFYTFEDDTLNDKIGDISATEKNKYNLEPCSSAGLEDSGRFQHSVYYNGSQCHKISSSNLDLEAFTGTFTLMAWLKHDANNNPKNILSRGGFTKDFRWRTLDWGGSPYPHIFLVNNGSDFETVQWDNSLNGLSANEWYHSAIRVDIPNQEISLFENGELVSTKTISSTQITSSGDLVIGARDTGGSNGWQGNIDDLRVFNKNLSQEEIKREMSTPSVPSMKNRDSLVFSNNFENWNSKIVLDNSNVGDLFVGNPNIPDDITYKPERTKGKFGGAFYFNDLDTLMLYDTTDKWGFTDTNDYYNGVTFSTYVNLNDNSTKSVFLGKDWDLIFWYQNYMIKTYFHNSTGDVISKMVGLNIPEDKWIHLTYRINISNNSVSWFKDGNKINQVGISNTKDIQNIMHWLFIGSRHVGSWQVKGKMDEIKLWRKPLSDEQISEEWNKNYLVNQEGAIGYWSFDKVKDDRVYNHRAQGSKSSPVGEAQDFYSKKEYSIDTSNNFLNENFQERTIAFWVYINDLSQEQVIWEMGQRRNGANCYIANQKLWCGSYSIDSPDGAYNVFINTDISKGWHYIVFNVNEQNLYVDGNKEKDGFQLDRLNNISETNSPTTIGGLIDSTRVETDSGIKKLWDDSVANFNGMIGTFRVYNEGLNSSEIDRLNEWRNPKDNLFFPYAVKHPTTNLNSPKTPSEIPPLFNISHDHYNNAPTNLYIVKGKMWDFANNLGSSPLNTLSTNYINPQSIEWEDNGHRLYTSNYNWMTQYWCPYAYHLENCKQMGDNRVFTNENVVGIEWIDDGNKLLIADEEEGSDIRQFNCNEPYDINSWCPFEGSLDIKNVTDYSSGEKIDINLTSGIDFNEKGGNLYITSLDSNGIYQYEFNGNEDISNLVKVASHESTVSGKTISSIVSRPDDNTIYTLGEFGTITEFRCYGDVSNCSFIKEFNLPHNDKVRGLEHDDNGRRLYVADFTNNELESWNLGEIITICTQYPPNECIYQGWGNNLSYNETITFRVESENDRDRLGGSGGSQKIEIFSFTTIIPEDTSFTVSIPSGTSSMDFYPTTPNSKMIEPRNQTSTIPFFNITNTGDINQTFSFKIGKNPTWQTTMVDIENIYSEGVVLNTSEQDIVNLESQQSKGMWFWANFTDAPEIEEQSNMTVSSNQTT